MKAESTNYNYKKYLPILVSFIASMFFTHGEYFFMPVINFFLVGAIPWTSIYVPFWLMIAIYCLVISAIATIYIENIIVNINRSKFDSKKRKLPKRRYSMFNQ